MYVCYRISFYLKISCSKWGTICIAGVYAGGMVHKICAKIAGFDLFFRQVPCKLMHNGCNHFKVCQLFRTWIRIKMTHQKAKMPVGYPA